MELGSVGSDAEDEFAEAVDAVGGSFEGLGGGIVRWASDDHLNRMVGEEGGSQAVGGGEQAVLRGDAGEGFERFLGEGVVAIVAGEGDDRSEEHTSELQSQSNLVCRLLLEKKKFGAITAPIIAFVLLLG